MAGARHSARPVWRVALRGGTRRARSVPAATGRRDGAGRRGRRARARPHGADGRDCHADRQPRRCRTFHRLRPSAVRRRRHAAGDQGASLRRRAGHPGRGRSHRACGLCPIGSIAQNGTASTRICRRKAISCSAWACSSAPACSAPGPMPTSRERLRGEAERLAGADAMGTLFKVLAIAPAGTRLPPFASAPGSGSG